MTLLVATKLYLLVVLVPYPLFLLLPMPQCAMCHVLPIVVLVTRGAEILVLLIELEILNLAIVIVAQLGNYQNALFAQLYQLLLIQPIKSTLFSASLTPKPY